MKKLFALFLFGPLVACSSSPSLNDGDAMSGNDSGTSANDSGQSDAGIAALPMNKWTPIDFPSNADVFTVWAEAKDRVWIGADDGFYESKDGRTFTKIDLGVPVSIRDVNPDVHLAPYARAAGSSGSTRVVLEYDPQKEKWSVFDWSTKFTFSKTGAPVRRISSAGGTFWLAMTDGKGVAVYDPDALFGEPNLYDARMGDLVSYMANTFAVCGPFATRAYAGGNRGVFYWQGATSGPGNWTKQTGDYDISDFFYAKGDVWAVGQGIHHWDGTAMMWIDVAPGTYDSIQSISDELWVAGPGALARTQDRLTFTTISFGSAKVNDVSGAAKDDLWAVGAGGKVWRCIGAMCGSASSAP